MRKMRRKDRELSKEAALEVIDRSAYSVMATVNSDGTPYCIPISPVRDGEWLYFHSALEGQKLDNIRRYDRVCVSCVGEQKAIPGKFALKFESAVIEGSAQEIVDREEKLRALRLISERYAPDNMAAFDKAIESDYDLTSVWKIHMDEISGKARRS